MPKQVTTELFDSPEQQLRGLLVMVLYSIRSERRLMEELSYNLLYRWFVGLGVDEAVWDVTVFTKNRERFIDGQIARKFFYATVEQARAQEVISGEHFTVDGTLIEAWASQKSFSRKKTPRAGPREGRSWQSERKLSRREAE